jgi:hypothetical protein
VLKTYRFLPKRERQGKPPVPRAFILYAALTAAAAAASLLALEWTHKSPVDAPALFVLAGVPYRPAVRCD